MQTGSLSVIISNYNHAQYIANALEAILSQSYRPLEVIIIDDASCDNSVEVIQRFVKKDSLVRLIVNEKNKGCIYNVNRFLSLARGDYIYSAAADDQVLPGFFEKSMSLLAQYPQAGLCTTDVIRLTESTGATCKWKVSPVAKPSYISSADLLKFMTRNFDPPITSNSVIMKRSALLEAGGFIPELEWSGDLFAILVIAFRYGLCYFPEPLAIFRARQGSYSWGFYQWPAQRKLIIAMMNLLQTPAYQDVRSLFRRMPYFSFLPGQVLRVAVSNPKYWCYISPVLLKYTLWAEIRRAIAKGAPLPAKTMYRYLRDWYWKKLNLSSDEHT